MLEYIVQISTKSIGPGIQYYCICGSYAGFSMQCGFLACQTNIIQDLSYFILLTDYILTEEKAQFIATKLLNWIAGETPADPLSLREAGRCLAGHRVHIPTVASLDPGRSLHCHKSF